MTFKLTPDIIAKIEGLVEHKLRRGDRASIIEYALRDMHALGGFIRTLRDLGADIPVTRAKNISGAELADFLRWRETQRAESQGHDSTLDGAPQ